jgi:hypothetical protein
MSFTDSSYVHQVNFAWANFILPIAAFKRAATHLQKCDLSNGNTVGNGDEIASLSVPSVSSDQPLSEQSGIHAYSTRLGVPSQDMFGIVYLAYLCACAVLLCLFFLVGLAMQVAVWTAKTPERKVVWTARRVRWGEMASNNSLRIVNLVLHCVLPFIYFTADDACPWNVGNILVLCKSSQDGTNQS